MLRSYDKGYLCSSVAAMILGLSTACTSPSSVGKGFLPSRTKDSDPLPGSTTVMSKEILDTTPENRPLELYRFRGGENPSIRGFFIFGIHGDEEPSLELGQHLLRWMNDHPDAWLGTEILVVPVANPDGAFRRSRTNAARVDLNRNFPASNWDPGVRTSRYHPGPYVASEIETRALCRLIEQERLDWIVSIHSPLRCVNYDGPGEALAAAMASQNGLPVKRSIGYPTPGSLGSYAGVDKRIPTVTLELESQLSELGISDHLRALAAAIRHSP